MGSFFIDAETIEKAEERAKQQGVSELKISYFVILIILSAFMLMAVGCEIDEEKQSKQMAVDFAGRVIGYDVKVDSYEELDAEEIAKELDETFYMVTGAVKREYDSKHYDVESIVESKGEDKWRLDNIAVDGQQVEIEDRKLWGDIGDSWDFKEVTISADERPAGPEEKGVIGTEPSDEPWGGRMDISFIGFTDSWNHQINYLEPDEFISEEELKNLETSEYKITYAKPGLDAETNPFEWLSLEVGASYETQRLQYIALEWEITDETNYSVLMQSMGSLIFIISGGDVGEVEAEDLWENVSQKLGYIDQEGYFVSQDEFIGIEKSVMYDGLQYELYSGDRWGEFIISPE